MFRIAMWAKFIFKRKRRYCLLSSMTWIHLFIYKIIIIVLRIALLCYVEELTIRFTSCSVLIILFLGFI